MRRFCIICFYPYLCKIEEIGVFEVHIFNSVFKTKYIVAFVLLMAVAAFACHAHIGQNFGMTEKTDFPVKSNMFFGDENTGVILIAPGKVSQFGRFESAKELKQRYNGVRQDKILLMEKSLIERYIINVYTNHSIPYYAEVCILLAQLIVMYTFLTDGKKRILKV